MNVWKMIAHHTDRDAATAWTRKHERIAIGWGLMGDIRKFEVVDDIKSAIRNTYPVPPYKNNAHLGAPSLWDFCHTLKPKDLVIVKGGKSGSMVVEITGNYEFVAGESPLYGDYQNQRRVRVTIIDPEALWKAAGESPGSNIYRTLVPCAHSVELSEIL